MAEYDLVIRGGTIVDGTGVPGYKADLAVKDGRVAKIRNWWCQCHLYRSTAPSPTWR